MDFNENKPIYLQLADQIMDEVGSPDFKPDSRVPSVREFASQTGVNPNTVMRTYTWLQQQKIIYNKRGVGYFFEADARNQVLTMRRDFFFRKEMPQFIAKMITLGINFEDFKKLYEKARTQQADL